MTIKRSKSSPFKPGDIVQLVEASNSFFKENGIAVGAVAYVRSANICAPKAYAELCKQLGEQKVKNEFIYVDWLEHNSNVLLHFSRFMVIGTVDCVRKPHKEVH